jgi:hypothetical protein
MLNNRWYWDALKRDEPHRPTLVQEGGHVHSETLASKLHDHQRLHQKALHRR